MIRKLVLALVSTALIATAPAPTAPKYEPIGPGYQPQDKDERGLWLQADEYEKELKHSNFVIRDEALNTYVRRVFCDMVGADQCAPIRIYIVRTPYFNASMAPNGTMIIWSGMFLRTRDEAQMAAILGHEFTHYRNRHSLQLFRDARNKLSAGMWLGMIIPFAQLALVGSILANSRDMEREADSQALSMMAARGYDPGAASKVWEQLRAEMDATAAARNRKSRKDKDRGMFQTHPPTAERMTELREQAAKIAVAGPVNNHAAAYRAVLAPHFATFVDDQIKLNDFGATEFLLAALAQDGWSSELHYMRGELYRARAQLEDFGVAATSYRAAIAMPDAPVESWRGLGLALLRSGDEPQGRAALKTYLQKKPDAADRAMIAMLSGEQG
jgi:beta-barrel assembly-enhancing protease